MGCEGNRWGLLVSGWWYEVQTAMNTSVWDNLLTIDSHLFIEILVKLLIDVFDDGHPAIIGSVSCVYVVRIEGSPFVIVNVVSKPGSVSHSQLEPYSLLFHNYTQSNSVNSSAYEQVLYIK